MYLLACMDDVAVGLTGPAAVLPARLRNAYTQFRKALKLARAQSDEGSQRALLNELQCTATRTGSAIDCAACTHKRY